MAISRSQIPKQVDPRSKMKRKTKVRGNGVAKRAKKCKVR